MASQQNAIDVYVPTPAEEDYIAFVAVGGLLPSEDGAATKMTVAQFAQQLNVDPATLWRWRTKIPNFWERVDKKRREIGGRDRLSKVWNGIFLKAASGNPEAAKLYLANFDPNFRMPMQKVEHEAGDSFIDALGMARRRSGAIEAEVVDEPNPES